MGVLESKRLYKIGRAANMLWCYFASEANPDEKNEFHLHVQCGWRLSYSNQITLAHMDMYYPHSKFDEDEDYNWNEIGSSRFDELASLFNASLDSTYSVKKVESDMLKGLKVLFQNGYLLEIFPNESINNNEVWRFIDKAAYKHLVVSGEGIEYD